MTEQCESGYLDVLNIGAGHMEFRFDKGNEAEAATAKKVIKDMLSRGYSIFVETEGGLRRVKRFDPEQECYIVEEPAETPKEPKKKRKLPMRTTKATGVGATAGG